MKARQVLVVAALSAVAMAAHAGGHGQGHAHSHSHGWYAEAGVTGLKASANGFSLRPEGLRLIVGFDINEFLAAEGMVGTGVNKGSVFNGTNTVTADLKYSVGAFIRPRLQLTDQLEVFGRAGWARSKMSASSTSGNAGSLSGTDFAYGLGVSYQVTPQWSVNADYMNYFSRGGLRVNGFTVGAGFRF